MMEPFLKTVLFLMFMYAFFCEKEEDFNFDSSEVSGVVNVNAKSTLGLLKNKQGK